jgi:hypothetical protein
MEEDQGALFEDSGGQEHRYSRDLNLGAEVDMVDFGLPTDAKLQDYLPRSYLPTESDSANSGWASGSVLVPSMYPESSMLCFNSLSEYRHGVGSDSYAFANPQNSSGLFVNGNTEGMIPDASPFGSENYTYSFPTNFEQDQLLENRSATFAEAFNIPNATSSSGYPSIVPQDTSADLVSTASFTQIQAQTNAKASSCDKYKLNEMVTCFPTNQKQVKAGRIKRPIPPGQREQYKLARNVRSCSRCKARKIKASDQMTDRAFYY